MLFRSPLLETLWPVGADTRCSGSLAARLVPGEGFETGVSRALPSPSPDHPSRGICNRKNWTDIITYTMIPFKEFDHSGLIILEKYHCVGYCVGAVFAGTCTPRAGSGRRPGGPRPEACLLAPVVPTCPHRALSFRGQNPTRQAATSGCKQCSHRVSHLHGHNVVHHLE